ncbi:hypothetical protein DPMN_149295 [Dreissena polymorpha]|uniref:Uncharacterized protein n=1 Tax=Dreissena polymorpha TaxID=45954 RepID=A0A9D4FDB0_DREPO|nr:hypothetical protein DPMN_149295 [Dreissena polymorpha]
MEQHIAYIYGKKTIYLNSYTIVPVGSTDECQSQYYYNKHGNQGSNHSKDDCANVRAFLVSVGHNFRYKAATNIITFKKVSDNFVDS